MITLQPFIDTHAPGPTVVPAAPELISKYRALLPAALLELWEHHGFGVYGDGLIQLINPEDYKRNLYGWLMFDEEDPSRLPIALSGLGHILYYRRLSTVGDEDISCLDPHGPGLEVLSWSLEGCFNDLLCNSQVLADWLDADRVAEAAARLGPLRSGEMFSYTPALRLGGTKAAACLTRCDALVQLELLLQLADKAA